MVAVELGCDVNGEVSVCAALLATMPVADERSSSDGEPVRRVVAVRLGSCRSCERMSVAAVVNAAWCEHVADGADDMRPAWCRGAGYVCVWRHRGRGVRACVSIVLLGSQARYWGVCLMGWMVVKEMMPTWPILHTA